MHVYIYICIYIILNYITNAPTCFNASVLSSGSFNNVYAKIYATEWRKLQNEELSDLYSLPNIVRVVKSSR
jgi:hypothetical protein